MTKEKFARLSDQMCEIPIPSYEILVKMICLVYDKAIYEPSFGDIYAELCIRLSLKAKQNPFVHIIESDEEPPTEDGVAGVGDGTSSSNTVFRWTNDVNTSDAEIVGFFDSPDRCIDAATNPDICPDPVQRGELELVLYSLKIQRGTFIKIMHEKQNPEKFYTVFFPMNKIDEVGQQLSELFLSEVECKKNATKQNSFKNILLNKCQDEFNKKDIYDGWKEEKKAYEEKKSSLAERDRLEQEEELEFRRMKIKKQMLGNIRFIGELYKKDMLKAKIMRFCIQSMLKMDELSDGTLIHIDEEMDEEDHEAVCKLFTTVGSTMDQGKNRAFIDLYFEKITMLSNDTKKLGSRPRFMYKDLIDLRRNGWVARREEETAKTLEEIKRDFERDERAAAQQSQQLHGNYRGGRGSNRQSKSGRNDYRDDRKDQYQSNKRSQKERYEVKVDKDGFQEVNYSSSRGNPSMNKSISSVPPPKILSRKSTEQGTIRSQLRNTEPTPAPKPEPAAAPEPLSGDKLKNRVKNIRAEFIQSSDVKELLLSMNELRTSPDAGKIMAQDSLDTAIDSKDEEREKIFNMLTTLYSEKKIAAQDIRPALGELIEFIGSFIVDSPKAMQYVSDAVADFIRVGAVDLAWLCEATKKLIGMDDHLIPGLIQVCIMSVVIRNGIEEARSCVSEKDISSLTDLVGPEKWKEISASLDD